MTLTTRLSVFFLATLAVVLIGFSVTLYFLARDNFYHESEEHLDGALTALIATADVDPDRVRWLAPQRDVNLAAVETWGQLLWVIRDDQGQIIDQSNQHDMANFPVPNNDLSAANSHDGNSLQWHGANWLIRQIELRPQAENMAPQKPDIADHNNEHKYRALSIAAAISLEAVEKTLFRLASVLVILSIAIWMAALFLGRAICRQALRPLMQMATAAGEIDAAAFERRLPLSGTHDELSDLGTSFNSLLDRLQESFERQRRFTSDASHQLRTPLTAILGQAEVALRRDRPPEEYQRVLRSICQGANHLRAIIESLLYLARTDREAMLPDREEVDLCDWLTSHVESWKDHPRSQDIVVDRADTAECRVALHPMLAGELVNLLLDNACKYSQPGTPIEVRIERDASVIRLLVQDHGIGMQERDLENVFVPFFRASQPRDRVVEGVGLGLSIAQRIAAAFGGTLSATSRPGTGSCFIVMLPAAIPAAAATGGAPDPNHPVASRVNAA